MDATGLVEALVGSGTGRGDPVAVVYHPEEGVGLASAAGSWSVAVPEGDRAVDAVERSCRPRWVMWSGQTAAALVEAGVRVATAWDVAGVHRLIFGGWAADPARVWAAAHGLPLDAMPSAAPPDLFSSLDPDPGDPAEPVRPDGYLRPDWVEADWVAAARTEGDRSYRAWSDGTWADGRWAGGRWADGGQPGGTEGLERWAALALEVADLQAARLAALDRHPTAAVTARSESAAELLCAEMTVDGLPVDRGVAEQILAGIIGPRPASDAEARALAARRDAEVLRHLPAGVEVDLRSSAQVKALLANLGVAVADTRAWRLRAIQDRHPVVAAFLAWRKAERVATTYGYGWLDRHLGGDGRLRGAWTASDGAAGRMTASAGLHNMPAELRPAVVAEPGSVFVRADLGQIEPRVLAAVSGDPALAAATVEEDLYLPVAAQLGVDRATAKVAVLGAMYGQTTGVGAQALRRLTAAYPVAVAHLEAAARTAEAGRELRTWGGRLIPMARVAGETPAATAARGRYGRNAVIQGAAAELFKTWAVTVRARGQDLGARIVLCLHDELLLHVAADRGPAVARLLEECLGEAVHRWAPGTPVRFTADVAVIARWSDAK